MERIPSKFSINIDYTDLFIGEVSSNPQLFSEVEGNLFISIDNIPVFSENGILLLELAKKLNDWIYEKQGDFEYYSMDYEEGPILFFKKEITGYWQFGSIWMEKVYSDIELSKIVVASKEFIDKLLYELQLKKVDFSNLF